MSTPEAAYKESLVSTVQDGLLTTENLSLELGDASFVYHRFGNKQVASPPLVMLQHFPGEPRQLGPGAGRSPRARIER
jgi:hypothetical protein